MKKRLGLFLLVITLSAAGCGQPNTDLKDKAGAVASEARDGAVASETGAMVSKTGEDSEFQQKEAGKSYYGTWSVESVSGTAAAYAMSEEESREMLGASLTYQEDVFLYQFPGKDEYEIPIEGYEEETITKEMFAESYISTLADLGVEQDEVTYVQAVCEGNVFGFMFYVVDESTMLVYYEGVFFEAHKV